MALRYRHGLGKQIDMCIEVCLTAFCCYAELEEGCEKAEDEVYQFHETKQYVEMRDWSRSTDWKPEWWVDGTHPAPIEGD